MTDTNSLVIIGRLTRDAELQATPNGSVMCKFSIAVNRSRKQADKWIEEVSFFDITLWGKHADALNKHLTKGKQVSIRGELVQDRWTDNEGKSRSAVKINAIDIQLLGGTQNGDNRKSHQEGQPDATTAQDSSLGGYNFADDVPF